MVEFLAILGAIGSGIGGIEILFKLIRRLRQKSSKSQLLESELDKDEEKKEEGVKDIDRNELTYEKLLVTSDELPTQFKSSYKSDILTNTKTQVKNNAKSQISQRLTYLLYLFNQNKYNKITISELAEFCGYSKTSDLEQYFFGLEEPSNEEKEKIGSCLGVNPEWLKHGKSEPFRSHEEHKLLAYGYKDIIKNQSPQEIIFIRSRSKAGQTVIVLRLNELKYIYFPKEWNISGEVGVTGQTQIYSFYKLVQYLQNLQSKDYDFRDVLIMGNHLDKEDFNDLVCGRIYPGSVIKPYNDTWWDDLTDINHSWAYSASYEEKYGKNFIEAQKIIKYLVERQP